MVTTQITEITASIDAIAARTDSAGAAVSPDWAAEERRMDHELQVVGILKPTDAYQVVAGASATMNIVVGSGTAKTDLAFVQGDIGGQGKYLVRFDEVDKTIALDAADPSDPRIDEVYLVVYDNIYDSTSRSLPRFVVRKGDAAASPSLPGADAAWEAFLLLSEITIPAAAADILAATLVDKRVTGGVDHGEAAGLADDDHTQYHTDARAVTWHDADDHSNLEESKEFSELGILVTKNGTSRWYPRFNIAITDVSISVSVAPTGAAVVVDVNKNAVTVFTTQSKRPSIAAAAFFDVSDVPDITALTGDTDYITVDIDQVGSTIAGEDLVVSIGYKRT